METRTIHHGAYPELTWTAVLVGWVIGSLITVAIGYTSLKLGFSIEGSELAAILGWGVLRGLMGRTSIVENNINQTIASAANGASSGMMFSIPALFILEAQYPGATEFNPALLVLACMAGALVGLCFVIPLRKQMIDFNRLAYPGGIATAAILKSPGAGARKAMILGVGALVSGTAHVFTLVYHTEKWELGGADGLARLPKRQLLPVGHDDRRRGSCRAAVACGSGREASCATSCSRPSWPSGVGQEWRRWSRCRMRRGRCGSSYFARSASAF